MMTIPNIFMLKSPVKKVLGTFEYLQIPVKVTSQNGEITLRTDGEKYQIMTDK